MGTSGQALQEQDKLLRRKSVAKNVSSHCLHNIATCFWYNATSCVEYLPRPPVTQRFQETSHDIHYCSVFTTRRTANPWYSTDLFHGTAKYWINILIHARISQCVCVCVCVCVFIHTGCFTTLGHNCRRWFPRSLWSRTFI